MGTVNNEDKIESNEPTLTANPIFEVRNKLLLRLMSSSVITQLFYPKVADKLYKTVPKFLKLLRYQFSPFFLPKKFSSKVSLSRRSKVQNTSVYTHRQELWLLFQFKTGKHKTTDL